jgi:hypothetical protein
MMNAPMAMGARVADPRWFEKPTTQEVDDTALGYLAPFAVPGQPDAFVEGGRLLGMGRPQQDA